HAAHQHDLQPLDAGSKAGIDEKLLHLGKTSQVGGVQRVHLRLRLLERGAGLQAADVVPAIAVAGVIGFHLRCERERRPETDLRVDERKAARHDADNGEWTARETKVAAEDRGVGAEELAPQPVTQDYLPFIADFSFAVVERAAERWTG